MQIFSQQPVSAFLPLFEPLGTCCRWWSSSHGNTSSVTTKWISSHGVVTAFFVAGVTLFSRLFVTERGKEQIEQPHSSAVAVDIRVTDWLTDGATSICYSSAQLDCVIEMCTFSAHFLLASKGESCLLFPFSFMMGITKLSHWILMSLVMMPSVLLKGSRSVRRRLYRKRESVVSVKVPLQLKDGKKCCTLPIRHCSSSSPPSKQFGQSWKTKQSLQ